MGGKSDGKGYKGDRRAKDDSKSSGKSKGGKDRSKNDNSYDWDYAPRGQRDDDGKSRKGGGRGRHDGDYEDRDHYSRESGGGKDRDNRGGKQRGGGKGDTDSRKDNESAAEVVSTPLKPLSSTAAAFQPSGMYADYSAMGYWNYTPIVCPPLWTEYAAEDGTLYYYNSRTGLTQWEKPPELEPPKPPAPPEDTGLGIEANSRVQRQNREDSGIGGSRTDPDQKDDARGSRGGRKGGDDRGDRGDRKGDRNDRADRDDRGDRGDRDRADRGGRDSGDRGDRGSRGGGDDDRDGDRATRPDRGNRGENKGKRNKAEGKGGSKGGGKGGQDAAEFGPPGCNLFVFHLPDDWVDDDLHEYFCPHGTVISAKVMKELGTGRSRGFGFVSYEERVSAATAIKKMQGYKILGKRLKVEFKKGEGEDSKAYDKSDDEDNPKKNYPDDERLIGYLRAISAKNVVQSLKESERSGDAGAAGSADEGGDN